MSKETRDLVKKIRDTKGTFHAKMGSIKDRNGTNLTEAEDIKKRWQEYWSGLPRSPPGDSPSPGIEPMSLTSPAVQAGPLPLPPPVRMVIIKNLQITNAGEDVEERKPSYTVSGNVN